MNIYKKWTLFVLLLPIPFVLALMILLYIYDPLMLYHKPYFREKSFIDNIRFSAKGLIDNENFNSVIIGTSMTENTSTKEANKKLDNRWINLSLSGSFINERAVILDYLFKKRKIYEIIYTLDAFTLNNSIVKSTKSFDFLYDNNIYNNFGVYFSKKFIFCALRFSQNSECVGKKDLNNLLNWKKDYASLYGGFENWLIFNSKQEIQKIKDMILNAQDFNPKANIDINLNKNYLNTYLLIFIKSHPDTQFHLIIPTYSRLLYRSLYLEREYFNKDSILFSKYQVVLKWLIKETSKYPNVKIYGFDDLAYADDIRNYKDPAHYNIDMNSMQLDAIKNGTHILTPQNMDEYFKTMEEKIRNYDLTPFVEFIKKNENFNID